MEDIAICDINLQLHRLYVSHHTSLHPLWTKKENIFCSVIKCHSLVLGVFLTAVAQVAVFSVVYVFKSQNIKWEFRKASALSDRRYLMRSFSWDKCGIVEFCLVGWTVKRRSNVEYFFFFRWRHLSVFAYI